ncbi:MAG: hypothetical protein CSA97_03335 [Bacteroidetes bacterium]|nr:MAG: hypothetical protein CSA97_03335 [Bacteroidota bacterium]
MIGRRLTEAVNTTFREYQWLFLYSSGVLIFAMLWAQLQLREFPVDLVCLDIAFGLAQGFVNLLILSQISRRWLRSLVAGLMLVLATGLSLVVLYVVVNFNLAVSSRIISVVLATNQNEALELLTNPALYRPMLWPLVGLGAIGVFSVLAHRFLHPRIRLYRPVVLLFTFLSIGLFVAMNGIATASYFRFRDGKWKPSIRYLILSAPEQLFWGYLECKWEEKYFEEQLASISQQEVEVEVKEAIKPFTLVIVLGESMRKEYMHCYGYALDNTPRIDSLLKIGRMALYTNAIAPAGHTISSVPESFSTHNIDSVNTKWFETPTLPQLLRKAGFRTVWTSNQNHISYHSAPISAIASACDSVFYLMYAIQDKSFEKLHDYDGALLPYLDQRADSTELLCQIIHVKGQHAQYKQRYPEAAFGRFGAEDIQEKPEEQRGAIAEYANAVLYGDYFLGEVVSRYEKDNALIIFFSDHGQALYDDSQNPDVLQHSDAMVGLRIPYMVYATERFIGTHGEIWERIMASKQGLFVNDLFTQSICQLLGIQADCLDSCENMFSPSYDWTTHRTVFGMEYNYPDTVDAPLSYRRWLMRQ